MRKIPILLISLIFLLGLTASASYISLGTQINSKIEKDALKVSVETVNKGDESAFNVQAEFRVGSKTILAQKANELPINQTYRAEVSFKPGLKKAGTYPLVMVMHYTDANQYPFSALNCQTFVYQKEAITPIFGQLRSTAFSRDGSVQLVMKNGGDQPITTKTYIVAPRELSVINNSVEINIPAKGEGGAVFDVKNFSALAGSTYQVYAVSEAEDADLHYTSIAPGTIRIIEANLFASYQFIFIALIVVLLLVFVALQFRK